MDYKSDTKKEDIKNMIDADKDPAEVWETVKLIPAGAKRYFITNYGQHCYMDHMTSKSILISFWKVFFEKVKTIIYESTL